MMIAQEAMAKFTIEKVGLLTGLPVAIRANMSWQDIAQHIKRTVRTPSPSHMKMYLHHPVRRAKGTYLALYCWSQLWQLRHSRFVKPNNFRRGDPTP